MSFAPKQFIRSVDFLSTENAINTSTGCVNIYGGMSVSKDSYLTNMIVVGNSTVTNLHITGALITSTGNTLTSSQWTSIDSNSDIYFGTSANAFVGIGTTTPGFNLDISGGSRITGGLTVGNLNVNTGATITNILNTTICTGTLLVSTGITTPSINATSITTASLRVSGTINSGDVTVGNINFTGSLFQNGSAYLGSQWTTTAGNTLTYTSGNVQINNTFTTSRLNVSSTASSSNSSTGSVVLQGGLSINNLTNATSVSDGGALTVAGGAAVSGDLIVGGSILYSNAAAASSTFAYLTLTASDWSTDVANGGLVVYGGISVQNTANATSASSGNGLTIAGGAGIGADLYVNGVSYLPNIVSTNNTTTNIRTTNLSSGIIQTSTGITTATIRVTGNADLSTGLTTVTDLTGTNITSGTVRASTLISTANLGANNITAGTIQASTLISTANLATNNFSSGTIRASTSVSTTSLLSTSASIGNISAASINLSENLNVAGTLTVVNVTTTNLMMSNGNAILNLVTSGSILNTGTITSGPLMLRTPNNYDGRILTLSTFTAGNSYNLTIDAVNNTNNNIYWSLGQNTLSSTYSNMLTFYGGNVGINTTQPSSKFVISDTGATKGHLKLVANTGATEDNWWLGFSHVDSSDSNDRARIGVKIQAGGPGRLFFTTGGYGAQAERMTIDASGNVGIGTTSPTFTLDVTGTARITTSLTTGSLFSTNQTTTNIVGTNTTFGGLTSTGLVYLLSTAGNIASTSNNYSITSGSVNITGDVVISGNQLFYTTTGVGAPAMNGRGDGSKIVLYPETNITKGDYSIGIESGYMWFQVPNINYAGYKFYQGTTTSLIMTPAGNVGIGTALPNASLELFSSIQSQPRLILSGQEFFTSGSTSTAGIAMLCGVNRTNNRQLWFADSANLTQNSTNSVIRITPTGTTIDAIATDGLTSLPLSLGNGSNNININGTIININGTTRVTNTTATSMGTLIVAGPGSTGYIPSTTTSGQLASFYGPGGNGIFSHIDFSTFLPGTSTNNQPAVRFSMKDLGAANSDFNILTRNGTSTGTMASRIFIDGSGNVGINTTNPGTTLHISGPAGTGTNGSTIITGYDSYGHSLYIGSYAVQKRLAFNHNGTVGNIFAYDYGSGTAQNLVLQGPGGSVGIGTASPLTKLHVEDGSVFIGDVSAGFSTSVPSSAGAPIATANGYRLFFDNSYNATAGTGVPANKIVLHNNSFTCGFGIENTGVTYHSGDSHRFYCAASNASTYGSLAFSISSTQTITYTNTNSEGLLKIGNSNAGSSAYSMLRIGNNIGDAVMFLNSNTRTIDGGINTFTIRNDAGALRLQGSGATNTIFLPGSSTNIGINTTSPRSNLEITQTSSTTGVMLYSGSNDGGVNRIIFNHSDTTSNYQKVSIETQASGAGQAGRGNFSIRVNTANDNTNVAAGDTRFFIHGTSGNVGIMTTSPSYPLHVSGDIYATGDVISFSDSRLKTDVETITGALDKVSNMRGVYYTNLNTQTRETGVIAQEIMDVLPEVVADRGEYLGVAYGNIVGVLIESIKELKARVVELENR